MSRILFVVIACALAVPRAQAQDSNSQAQVAASPEESAIRQQLKSYLDAFNQHDAAAVAKFWTLDCASLAEDSNERISGRDALQERMADFFKDQPDAQMTGEITNIKIVRPDVALLEGTTTLLLTDSEPVVST
ncbi:MAG: nuclear transport factor 2 family protein [Planctomycetaceae bacterium]